MLAAELVANGVAVTVHDPLALANVRTLLGSQVRYAEALEEAVAGAAVIVIATPDPSFHDLVAIIDRRGGDAVIVDCWRLLSATPSRARIISVGVH
jgi:predicted dinucleotide-binding enzyme